MFPFDNSYARLPDGFFASIHPESVPEAALIKVNTGLAKLLGLDEDWLLSEDGLAMLSGQKLPEGAEPIAMAYAGHQFGGWSPRLGDGRAILIGEIISQDNIRRDIQLKGSGRTPFSRDGDGKSALGPVLREYIVSEAMAALGIPTTRALAAVTTGEIVYRAPPQPGAILTRVAQSHIRIGTFQYFYAQGDHEAVKTLADYGIDRHYPQATQGGNPYKNFLLSVLERQAELIAQWMSVGFIHGVMNTDNMHIAGETIDYGPCAFMDNFHPAKKFSAIDQHGRYAWGNQPAMAHWNLTRLAETLLPLLDKDQEQAKKDAEDVLDRFHSVFTKSFSKKFSQKLGLPGNLEGQHDLIPATFEVMTKNEVDFTLFFRHLTKIAAKTSEAASTEVLRGLFNDPAACDLWLECWQEHWLQDPSSQDERLHIMQQNNPIFIPRNHQIAKAIKAGEQGDFELFHHLVSVLANPFDEQPEHASLEDKPLAHEIIHQTFCGT